MWHPWNDALIQFYWSCRCVINEFITMTSWISNQKYFFISLTAPRVSMRCINRHNLGISETDVIMNSDYKEPEADFRLRCDSIPVPPDLGCIHRKRPRTSMFFLSLSDATASAANFGLDKEFRGRREQVRLVIFGGLSPAKFNQIKADTRMEESSEVVEKAKIFSNMSTQERHRIQIFGSGYLG